MTEYAQLETPEAVRAALERGEAVERMTNAGVWRPVPTRITDSGIAEYLVAGFEFRAPLPAVQASDVAAALDRIDALLDPERGLLPVPYTSATANASRADMATIRAALSPAPATTAPKDGLRARLQRTCSAWDAYWRAPDSHGVILTAMQAVELLEDALGVEVEINVCLDNLDTDDTDAAAHMDATPTAAVPAAGDWVLVPRVPTQAMIDAADMRDDDEPASDWGKIRPASREAIWSAMLAATPAPPDIDSQGDDDAARRYIRDWCPDHVKDYIARQSETLPAAPPSPAETREAVAEQVESLAAMLCDDFKGPLEVRYEDRCQAGKDRWREKARRILRSFGAPPATPDLLARLGELADRWREGNGDYPESLQDCADELRALITGAQK